MAKVTKAYAAQLAEQGLTPFMDWAHTSPRAYRGAVSGRDGHNGTRTKDGTWAKSNVSRKRWTTALHEDALDKLHDLAKYAGVNRCEIVEAMLMSPQCRELALQAIQGSSSTTKQLSLHEEVQEAINAYGKAWPRRLAAEIGTRHQVSRQAVSQLKQRMLRG